MVLARAQALSTLVVLLMSATGNFVVVIDNLADIAACFAEPEVAQSAHYKVNVDSLYDAEA